MSTAFYRTEDGQADYQFSFEEQNDGTWRAYIVSQPDYDGRPSNGHATHRFTDGPRHYVCWSKPLRSEKEARAVAAAWADATQKYIRNGTRF